MIGRLIKKNSCSFEINPCAVKVELVPHKGLFIGEYYTDTVPDFSNRPVKAMSSS